MVDDSTAGGAGADEADARADAIRFVTRDVSDEEAAAVTAVLLAALDEAATSGARRRSGPQRVGAERSARFARRSTSGPAPGDARVADRPGAESRVPRFPARRPPFRRRMIPGTARIGACRRAG